MNSFPSRMLFRPTVVIPRLSDQSGPDGDLSRWSGVTPLPALEELDGGASFAQVLVAWSEAGLHVAARLDKPQGAVTTNRRRPHTADCLQVWVDTRATQSTHRATRFCHCFVLLPRSASSRPTAWQANIRRARERPALCDPEDIRVASQIGEGCYTLEALLPAHTLNGYDPRPGAQVGFTYFAHDVPGGKQQWSAPTSVPMDTDPSLWGILELGE